MWGFKFEIKIVSTIVTETLKNVSSWWFKMEPIKRIYARNWSFKFILIPIQSVLWRGQKCVHRL